MTLRWKLRIAALLISLVIAFSIMFVRFHKHHVVAGDLVISHARSVATAPGAPVAGGYMTIKNGGTAADFLIGATSPFSASVAIHQSTTVDGVMKMRPVQGGVEIPAGQTIELEPKGLHLMFMELNAPLKADEMTPITLHFEVAGDVDVNLHIGDSGGGGHAGH